MKKFFPLLIVAAGAVGAAAYLITKKNKEEKQEEIKVITLDELSEEECCDIKGVDNPSENSKFPNLSEKFIDDTKRFGANFSVEYPEGTAVRVNHIVKFERVEDLIGFVKLSRENDYLVQEAEEENTILVISQSIVAEGTIIEEVLELANEAYGSSGEYLGFRVDRL